MNKTTHLNRENIRSTQAQLIRRVLLVVLGGSHATPVKLYLFTRARVRRISVVTIMTVLVLSFAAASTFTLSHPAATAATTANTVNFQARLMNASGSIVPDGNYNVEFKLYNASSSSGSAQGSCTGDANCLWTETRTGGNVATVANGYLTVNLGSVNALPSNIWNQQLWLSMRIGGTGAPSWDTEMSPRLLLTAVPAAYSLTQYNSTTGLSSSLSLQAPTVGNQSFVIPDQAAAGTYNLCVQNSAACGFIQNATSLQTGANFNIGGNGFIGGTLGVGYASLGSGVAAFNGNVGIGTSSPVAATEINNFASDQVGLVVRGSVSQSTNIFEVRSNPTSNSLLFGIGPDGSITTSSGITSQDNGGGSITPLTLISSLSQSANILTVKRSDSTPYFTINSAGKVGIGTAVPGAKLEVDGAASGMGLIVKNNTTTPGDLLELQDSSGAWIDRFTSNGNLILGNNSAAARLYFGDGSSSSLISIGSAIQANDVTLSIPADTHTTDMLCLQTLANCSGGTALSLGTYSTTNTNAHGATLSAGVLTFQDASASAPGMVSTGGQTFAGSKTFNDTVRLGGGTTAISSSSITTNVTANLSGIFNGNAAISGVSSLSAISSTFSGNTTSLTVSGTPTAGTGTTALVQLGNTISGGNAATNGGTYLGLNAPSTGAGSAADFLNFQKNGSSKFLIDNTGSITFAGDFNQLGTSATLVGCAYMTQLSLDLSGCGGGGYSINASGQPLWLNGVMIGADSGLAGSYFMVQDSSGKNILSIDNTNEKLVLGTVTSTSGQQLAGKLTFADGTLDNFGLTLQSSTITANRTYSFPNSTAATDTICLQTLANCSGGGSGVTTVGTFANTNVYANAANITGSTITIGAADATHPGAVTTGAQTFAGDKTFGGNVTTSGLSVTDVNSNTLAFTGSGLHVTSGAFNTALVVNGGSSSDQTSILAQAGNPGGVTSPTIVSKLQTAQTGDLFQLQNTSGVALSSFGANGQLTLGRMAASGTVTKGQLTFADGTTDNFGLTVQSSTITASRTYSFPNSTATTDTICLQTLANCSGGGGVATIGALDGGTANTNGATISGSTLYLQSASMTMPGLVNTTTQSFWGNKTFVQDTTFGSGNTNVSVQGFLGISGASTSPALSITSTPAASATASLIKIGSPIVGGNAVTNGGTYIGLNAPGTGVGSVADFLNFQNAGNQMFRVTGDGDTDIYGGLAVHDYMSEGVLLNGITNVLAANLAGGALTVDNTVGPSLIVQGGGGQDAAPTMIIENDNLGQTGDLLRLQGAGSVIGSKFSVNGNQLTLGTLAASGTVYKGQLTFSDGTTDNRSVSLQSGTLTASYTLTLPTAVGSSNQCLQATNGTGSLGWTSCAKTDLSNLGSTAINADLVPDTDNTYTLGTTTNRWKDLYLGPGSLHIGSNGDDGSISYDAASQDILFKVNGTTKLSVSQLGSLGVSSGTGSATLSVSSDTTTAQGSTFGDIDFKTRDTSTSAWSDLASGAGIRHFVIDTNNNVLYGFNSGNVYRCSLATNCDSAADWNNWSFYTLANAVGNVSFPGGSHNPVTFDSANGVIYAGSGNGTIQRCAVSTGCDASADWTVPLDTTESSIDSMQYSSSDGSIFAASYSGGIIYRCSVSTACDASGDWTTVYDTTDTRPNGFAIDSTGNYIYLTISSDLYRCDLSTHCDSSSEWSLYVNFGTMFSAGNGIHGITWDSARDQLYVVYMGSGGWDQVKKCTLSLDCTSSANWITAAPALALNENYDDIAIANDVMYIGTGQNSTNDGRIYSCPLSTGCNTTSEWGVAFDSPSTDVFAIIGNPSGGAVYAGTTSTVYVNGGTFIQSLTNFAQIQAVAVNTQDLSETGALLFNTMNSGTLGEGMRLQGGKLGIGNTNPSYKLDVADNQASNYVMRIQNTNTANTADGLLIDLGVANASRGTGNYFIGFSGGGTVAGKIQGGASAVAYTTSAADYAEYFKADAGDMPQAGELVTMNADDGQAVVRTGTAGDFITGVVSTNPGFVGNAPICKVDDNNCDSDYSKYNVLVSMVGQVPVKVSMDGGAIKPGDPIGASDVPGIGMKVSNPGTPIIGYAMAATNEDGKVTVLVRPGYYTPEASTLVQGNGQSVVSGLTVNGALAASSINVGGLASIGELNVSGTASIGGNLSVAGGLTVTGATSVMDITIGGHIVTAGNVPLAKVLAAAGQNALVTITGNDTSGTVTITTGNAAQDATKNIPAVAGPTSGELVQILFAKQFGQTPQVDLTAGNAAAADLHIWRGTALDHFSINVNDTPAPNKVYVFDYFVRQ